MTTLRFAIVLAACSVAAAARALPPVAAGVELVSDERRRGLSWSDGKPSGSAWLTVPVGRLSVAARATALRDSPRFGGAAAVIDGTLRYRLRRGAWRFDIGGVGHVFGGGRGTRDFGEVTGEAGVAVGPADLSLYADYAPRQKAIGGDNLHVGTAASLALVGTPFTLDGQIGRSWGSVGDAPRAARLRPGGSYTDWQGSVTATRGRFSIGASLSGTSGATGARHSGRRAIARLAARF